MVDVLRVTVTQSAKELEREPFSFYVLEEGSCAQAIVEGVVQVLPDEVSVRFGFDDSLVPEGIRNVGKGFSLTCQIEFQSCVSI